MTLSRKDPIIEEIHAVREEIARESDYDLEKILEAARARQAESGLQGVRLPPRKADLALERLTKPIAGPTGRENLAQG